MRKLLTILIAVLLLLTFLGCNEASDPADTLTPTIPEDTTVSISDKPGQNDSSDTTQLPLYSVSLPKAITEYTADDGNVILQYVHQNISLILPEPEVADKIILDYLNNADADSDYIADAVNTAKFAYRDNSAMTPHLYQVLDSAARLDGSVLSLYGDIIYYSGGAHPFYACRSLNYNILNGNRLKLTDVLLDNVTTKDVLEDIEYALSLDAPQLTLFRGYEDLLPYYISSDLSECQNWFFAANGLGFCFAPGEIGPVASGVIWAVIPYRILTDTLRPEYFPAEEFPDHGHMTVQMFEPDKLTEYDRFSELITTPGSTKIIFSTDKTVYDIKIFEDDKKSSGFNYNILYALHTLSPSDALLMEADFSVGTYTISYRTMRGVQTFTITVNEDTVKLNPF